MDAFVLLGSFVVLMLVGMPVAYALGMAALVGAIWIDLPLDGVMIQMASGVNKFRCLLFPVLCWRVPSWPRAAWRVGWSRLPAFWWALSEVACRW